MQTFLDLLMWLWSHVDALFGVLFALEVAAVTIVNMTPTSVDNRILRSFHKVLVALANIVPNARTTPEMQRAEEAMKTLKE
ncbi:hypothetical protein GJU92_07895 [Brucella sp. 10RB9213]|nr:hypothetical protein [Brucella sp. 10RB9213]